MVEPVAAPLLFFPPMRGIAIALVSLTACVDPGSSWSSGDDDDGTGGDTTPTTPTTPASADGTYHVQSQYDVGVDNVLPEPAYEMVSTLDNFSVAPAHTLLDLAEDAGVSAVGTLRDALPSVLESKLEGWIDEQIAKITIGGVPITQIAGEIADLGRTTLVTFNIDSELVVDGTHATHTLTKIEFSGNASLSLGNLPADLTTKSITATRTGDTLALGDHSYGLPYGLYAWQAIEQQTVAKFGATPRELLGQAVNCPAIAHTVANKCVLGVCVGHETELAQICERGLDEVIAVAQRKIEAMQFEALHHAKGVATLVDTDHDGHCDRIDDGVWTADIDLSQGLRPIPATFAATK